MDDKRIEDLLRNTLRATPPEGMRDSTLRPARLELKKRQAKSRMLGVSSWKAALTVCSVLIAILTNISNSARQERIGEMVCRPSASAPRTQIAQADSPQEWESRQAEILDRLHEIEGTDAL